jgi:ATP-binding cassette, subfamily B, bacterial
MAKLDFTELAWPVSRLGELIENLAYRGKLYPRSALTPQPPDHLAQTGDETIGRWIDVAAGSLDLEADPVQFLYSESESFIRHAGPAILRMPGELSGTTPLLLGLVKSKRKQVYFLGPDVKLHRVPLQAICDVLGQPLEAPVEANIDQLLREAEVPTQRWPSARRAIFLEQLGPTQIQGGWLLRLSPGSDMWKQFRHAHLLQPLMGLFGLFLIQQALFILSWWVIGRGVFQGHFDLGWITAWAILLFTTIPLQLILNDAQSSLSIGAGTIFKRRLIYGTLKLDPEEIRHQGMGQFLARVMESEAVEMLALSGGLNAILALAQLVTAAIVLYMGAGGMFSVLVLFVWAVMTLIILWQYALKTKNWTEIYQNMTNDLVERMVGHRTRLAQEDRQHWHDEEDIILDRYLKSSFELDQRGLQLSAFISRGWLVVGLGMIAYLFVVSPTAVSKLAVSLGGVLLAARALGQLAGGAQSLVGLWIAWRQVGPLFKAAARPRDSQALDFVFSPETGQFGEDSNRLEITEEGDKQPLISARDLTFRYRTQGPPVLEYLDLQINQGERVLLEGPSGGGKSTLAALLTGLRLPESGSLLLWGFDRQILGGEEWRRRAVMAPQFQENHVFAETFAFNLLMGRRWPPTPQDLQEAEEICRELGLGELIDRMPSGLQQMVGENGWQLSHGERSRLFIARTLLQGADLIVLDESFGALDPENLERALRSVLNRAPTLVVIAHP